MDRSRYAYLNDANYHRLVDTLLELIHECQFTPSEIRTAAMLASIMYEERRVFPSTIFIKKKEKENVM